MSAERALERPLSRFVVQSSDVLSDLRVNVREETSERVLWYKERYLSENEIVESIFDNATSSVLWTIHRPTRGWYLRLRAPSFPPGSFISLLPVANEAQHYSPAALSFSCRTNMPSMIPRKYRTLSMETDSTLNDDSGIHSYPPTPPAVIVVQPPSPSAVRAKLKDIVPRPIRLNSSPQPSLLQTQITEFYLTPLSVVNQRQMNRGSFFSRALSVFASNSWPDSNSFRLYPVKPISLPAYPLPAGVRASVLPMPQISSIPGVPAEPIPLLTFHDRTSVLTAGSITGLIEIDQTIERLLGVQVSFWIAIALTYLGNLEERESYLAANSD